jgi:hypothetical protein
MKTTLASLLILISAFSIQAQKKSIDVNNFTKLSFSVAGTVYLSQGSKNEVVIEADNDTMDKVEVIQDGDRLKIRMKRSNGWGNWNSGKVTAYVTMKTIEDISVSGSGKLIGKTTIEGGDIDLDVSGSGSMEMDLRAEDVNIDISGSGSVSLNGNSDKIDIDISGSGRVKAEDFVVNICKAQISGSGSCYITANKEIDAQISGSGTIYYHGSPDRVSSHSSGSGKVKKL